MKKFQRRRFARAVSALALGMGLAGVPALSRAQSGWRASSESWGREDLPEFPRDIFPGQKFVFTRVRYNSRGYRWRWRIDYPDSDENFSQRLSELTTIEVARDNLGHVQHVVVDLLDDRLFEYPLIYMVEVGRLEFSQAERDRLRDYLLRGGFLHVDDFWGNEEWANWEHEIGQVFPPDEYPIKDIPLSHPLYHCVFDVREVPQIPSIEFWMATGETSERGSESRVPHCRGIFDKRDRLMVVMTHNTDLGDGWEREGESAEYFREFSAKKAYPLGINIVVYAMTH